MYTLRLRSTNFPKTLRPFQKPRWQKSDINEVHNLKFRQCVGVVTHTLSMSVTLPRAVSDFLHWIHLKGSLHVFEVVHMEIQDCYNGNKHDIVCQNPLHDIKSMCILQLA
jgi:hypothetical protein